MENLPVQPRVLVVDDDPEMVTLVKEVLSLIRCDVLVAPSGKAGIAQLQQAQANGKAVDAMLLDVRLPDADGFEILEQVKSDGSLRQIPVLLVTGVNEVHNKARGLEMGADDYVTKPFDSQELLARLNAVLRIRRTEQMLRRRNQELAALNEISRMVSASLDLDRVLASALEGLDRLVEALALAIILNDEDSDAWVVRTSRSPEGTWLEGRVVPVDETPASETLASGAPILETALREGFWPKALGLASVDLLYVPLLMHDEPIGILTVLGKPHSLDHRYLPLLEHIASTVSVAVENARLYGELTAFAEALQRSQDQLVQAEKMAAVGRLAASLAHEINNPLQAVQNSMHLATHRNVDETGRQRYLELAQQEVERLVHIVRRMLDFYRPASGLLESLDINKAITDALSIANKRLQQAKIEVTVRLAPDLPPVLGSANQLTQVFLNIIINAIEAMPTGGQFWVGSAYHEERNQTVAAFRDNGPGILPEVREHLFEPFFTTKPTGTGLGLAISYGIVERHRGEIRVESTPGEGATFIVHLPRYLEEG
ncbi:MAG: response regulator [Anaerolineae bacterium]|nr:response regulator [Anaerolineae bacterium]